MNDKRQLIAFYTLVRHEVVRMFRITTQVFLPAAITTSLYFLIFGSVLGSRVGLVNGVSYPLFIAPGLIMMTVITNSYGNVSSSLFSARFQKSIEEILVSPMSNWLLLSGYVFGGILRGTLVACLVFVVSLCFIQIPFSHPFLSFMIILLAATIFSLAGFANALFARSFDNIMLIPTFVLTPLTYLGGVFYSTQLLSPFWISLSHVNPIWYMVGALRFAMIQSHEVNIALAMSLMVSLVVGLFLFNLCLLKRGIGLRE